MLKLVLLGPPGSGKGTQAARLVERTGAQHISTGDLLRAEVAADTPLGRQVAGVQASGELVPDEVVLRITLPLVLAAAADAGYVLDGFPRSVAQARSLDELVPPAARVEHVVLLSVPAPELLDRMRSRAAQEHRPDDTGPVFRRRLDVYESQTRPLIDYYGKRGLLAEVDAASEDPGDVFDRIRAVLEL